MEATNRETGSALTRLTIRPLDVVMFRGNRLFSVTNASEAVMPPWPSVFAGALRSHLLAAHELDPGRFLSGQQNHDRLGPVLGTYDKPGSFRILTLGLALRRAGRWQAYFPSPAGLTWREGDQASGGASGGLQAQVCRAYRLPSALATSHPLPAVPALQGLKMGKPKSNVWISAEQYARYLQGAVPTEGLEAAQLWKLDFRLGIALDNVTRSVEEGRLYTVHAVSLAEDVVFFVEIQAPDDLFRDGALVRLGGDGRGAALEKWSDDLVGMDRLRRVPSSGRKFKLVLATDGLFPRGWRIPGLVGQSDAGGLEGDGGAVFDYQGLRAKLVTALVPRNRVISGWDLKKRAPKPAWRAVPQGAEYWFELVDPDDDLSHHQAALHSLVEEGLWPLIQRDLSSESASESRLKEYERRRPEGFNNLWIGSWGGLQEQQERE